MISATCVHVASGIAAHPPATSQPTLVSQAGEGVGEGFALSEPTGDPTG